MAKLKIPVGGPDTCVLALNTPWVQWTIVRKSLLSVSQFSHQQKNEFDQMMFNVSLLLRFFEFTCNMTSIIFMVMWAPLLPGTVFPGTVDHSLFYSCLGSSHFAFEMSLCCPLPWKAFTDSPNSATPCSVLWQPFLHLYLLWDSNQLL